MTQSPRPRPVSRGGGRRHFRFRAGIAVLAALLSTAFAAPAGAQPSSGPPAGTLREAVADVALDRAGATAARLAVDSRESQVAVERRAGEGEWAFGSVVLTAAPDEHASPQGWLYLARAEAGEWDIALEGGAGFRAMVAHTPEGLLSTKERTILAKVGTHEPAAAGFANTGLTLPWGVGQTWTWTGGPHPFGVGGAGAWSSMDFSGGDGIARAARGGVAYAMCASGGYRGWIRIYHDNGLSTDYYHLVNNIKPHGAAVGAGTPLGYVGNDVSCGGASSGPHVHFSLLSGDTYINVHGAVIGGWQFSAGAAPYQGTAYNGGVVVGVGAGLYNYGPSPAKHGEH
jgi:LasA protease